MRGEVVKTPPRTPVPQVLKGVQVGNTAPFPPNGAVADLIASEQFQQVKRRYLTRCLLAGLSTSASIN